MNDTYKTSSAVLLILLLISLYYNFNSQNTDSAQTEKQQIIQQEDLQNYFKTHKVGMSPDYAVMKNGIDHLLTIHGYADDLQACLMLIEPYNNDPSLSVLPGAYTCEPLNE